MEPYYRISTATSELEGILYETADVVGRVQTDETVQKAHGRDKVFSSIGVLKAKHRFPFRTAFTPVLISANQFITHDNATNRRFSIEYGGEYSARMYQAIDVSIGTIASTSDLHTVGWAYCDNFIASLLELASYKVSTDPLYEFTGRMFYIWYSHIVPMAARPALTRCLHESCWEFKWAYGAASQDLTTQYNRTSVTGALAMQHPYSPLQSYETTHAAFTAYIPYNLFTMANVANAYPMVAVFSLNRVLEYTFNTLLSCINVWANVLAVADPPADAESGLVNPAGVTAYTWAATPAITATRLIVEYYSLHQALQNTLAMNAHGFLIRQYFEDTVAISDTSTTSREISITKIIETLYMLARHERNIIPTPLDTGVDTLLIAGAQEDKYHLVDPYFMPIDEWPINLITLAARGQLFYRDLTWEEVSAVNSFLFSSKDGGTSYNHCLGIFTFAQEYFNPQQTGSYNSGFGPNLRLSWRASAFSQLDPGRLSTIIQGMNMVLAYRGTLSIRYT